MLLRTFKSDMVYRILSIDNSCTLGQVVHCWPLNVMNYLDIPENDNELVQIQNRSSPLQSTDNSI